jgi:hypothetical protein
MSGRCEQCGAKPAWRHERTGKHLCGGHRWRADKQWQRELEAWGRESHELPSWMLPAIFACGIVLVLCVRATL